MYVTSDDASIASTPQPVIPEDNFNVPQSTSDAYQTSTTPDGNFNPVNDVMPSVPGGLLRFLLLRMDFIGPLWENSLELTELSSINKVRV
jgi:hypothetical protein